MAFGRRHRRLRLATAPALGQELGEATGDVSPKTTVGRAIGLALMIVGVGLFGLLTARVAAFFVESER